MKSTSTAQSGAARSVSTFSDPQGAQTRRSQTAPEAELRDEAVGELRVWRPPTFGKGPTAPSCGKGHPTGRGARRGAAGDHPPAPTNPAGSQRPRRLKQRTTPKHRSKTAALARRILNEAY